MKSGRTGNKPDVSGSGRWMQTAVRYLAIGDRTGAQVRDYLLRKGASPNQAEQVALRLSDLGYLNDRGYAERWIASRLARRPMGREALRSELEARGVADSVVEGAIREAFRDMDDDALARLALDVAQRGGRRLTPGQQVRLLRQRGFEEDTIGRMMGESIANEGSM